MKRIAVVLLVLGLIALGGFFFIRQKLSTPGFVAPVTKDSSYSPVAASSPLDLKPQLIRKLQQVVNKGSKGLYNLFVHEIDPDVAGSSIRLNKVLIEPDSSRMSEMKGSNQLPDDVFKISFASMNVEGLGVKDLVNTKNIKLTSVRFKEPVIDVYHHKSGKANVADSETLYKRIADAFEQFSLDTLLIQDAVIINHDATKKTSTKFEAVNLSFYNILIDSASQYDRDRFLFAKNVSLSIDNYVALSSDGIYQTKIDRITVAAPDGNVVIRNLSINPRFDRESFEKKVGKQKEMYTLSAGQLKCAGMEWWDMLNSESLIATQAWLSDVKFTVYLDRSLPPSGTKPNNFPHQLLMKMPLKVYIPKLNISNVDVVYEEFNPEVGRSGKVFVDDLKGTVSNITNMPDRIRRKSKTNIYATATLMHSVPTKLTLGFDLANASTGKFTAGIESKGFDGKIMNGIGEPVGLFSIKRGKVQSISSHIAGDTKGASGKVTFLYNDLHMVPLKPDKSRETGLRKKSVTSFIANTFILKEENPKNGETRQADASFHRDGQGSFFNLLWKTTFVGILKTIGAPEKIAYQ